MTKLNPEQEGLVEEVGRQWLRHKAEKAGIEARIRKKVKAEMEEVITKSAVEVAQSMRVALEGGVTRIALKNVTSKNPGTLESFLSVLSPEVVEEQAQEEAAVDIEWAGKDLLRIQIHPATALNMIADRNVPELWAGEYEVFTRSEDGAVFIDPSPTVPTLSGVTEWLRSGKANEDRVIAWVGENPPSE